MIVRHQRESVSNKGFRNLARYIRGRDTKPRATWFLAAYLPGVTGADDLALACKLVDAVQAQNTRAGSKRTYHLVISLHPDDRRLERRELQQIVERLVDTAGFSEHQYIAVRHSDTDHEHIQVEINKIHPETFRMHSPAWDHQKLFTQARALKRKLAIQRKAIQKTWHPGTWPRFGATRTAERDARAIRLVQQRERERGRINEEREL